MKPSCPPGALGDACAPAREAWAATIKLGVFFKDGDSVCRDIEGVVGWVGLSNRLSSVGFAGFVGSYEREVAALPFARCPSSLLAVMAFMTASGLPLGFCGMPLPFRDRFDEGMILALLPFPEACEGLEIGECPAGEEDWGTRTVRSGESGVVGYVGDTLVAPSLFALRLSSSS